LEQTTGTGSKETNPLPSTSAAQVSASVLMPVS
jgi:hypothetical protein